MKQSLFHWIRLLMVLGLSSSEPCRCLAAEPGLPAADKVIRDPIVISIRNGLQTDSRLIRLVDVANITGGDPALRERIKQLDIEDSLTPGESVTIYPPQIEFRLRIAGIDVDRVSIRGSAIRVTARQAGGSREAVKEKNGSSGSVNPGSGPKVPRPLDYSSISFDEGPLEREMIQAAKECLLGKLPWAAENVECRLLQPLSAELRQIDSAAGYEISADLQSSGPPVGRVQVHVTAEAQDKPKLEVNIFLEVRHIDQIVLAAKTIERGHLITAADLYIDRQDVTDLPDFSTNIGDLVGMTARRSIRALLPVRMIDVEAKGRNDAPMAVKRRDQVKMIARLGNLSVTAMGEAMQDGRVGETIRLRNVESNANIQGRVIAQGEVEISF